MVMLCKLELRVTGVGIPDFPESASVTAKTSGPKAPRKGGPIQMQIQTQIVSTLKGALGKSLKAIAVAITVAVLTPIVLTGAATADQAAAEPDQKPDRLIVRTWGGPWRTTYEEGAAASFTAKTGIPVEFDGTGTSEIQAKILQSVRAGTRPPVDVVLTVASLAYAAQVQGIAIPLDKHILTNLDQLSSIAMPEGTTAYLNVASYSQPIVYNPEAVDMPDSISWEEIFDEKYAGKLFLTSTFASLLHPIAKMMGVNPATDDLTPVFAKISELKNSVSALGDEEEFIAGIEAGEVTIGITLAATALEIDGLKWIVPTEGAVLGTEAFYVPAGLPENVAFYAQMFINETVSAANQSAIASGIGEVPVNMNATIPDFMIGDPAFPFTEEDIAKYGIVTPVELDARNRDKWQAAFTAAIQR
jgi:putative spermidine/putrescine transport system substrate-binding protein